MSRYFIVEVKDKHVTRHEIFLALVEKLGLGVVVTVEPASQQSVQADLPTRCPECEELTVYGSSCHNALCPSASR